VWFEGISGQVGLGRSAAGVNATEGLDERLHSAEREAGSHERDMSSFERERIDLEHRVSRMEAELESLRKRRLEVYARWWNARDDRDRARHVCRRLRKKIDKARKRGGEG
jgi:chromosome segregation ATPase